MALNTKRERVQVFTLDEAGLTPTVPSVQDHKTAGWIDETDIYKGEIAINLVDELLWTRTDAGIISIDLAGAAVPAGANTQIQFNDAGAFGGDAGLTYDKTTDIFTITNGTQTILNTTTTNGGLELFEATLAVTSTSDTSDNYEGGKFVVTGGGAGIDYSAGDGGLIGLQSTIANIGTGVLTLGLGLTVSINNSSTGTITEADFIRLNPTNTLLAGTFSEVNGMRFGNVSGLGSISDYNAFNFESQWISNSRAIKIEANTYGFIPISTADTGITFASSNLTFATTTLGDINISAIDDINISTVDGQFVLTVPLSDIIFNVSDSGMVVLQNTSLGSTGVNIETYQNSPSPAVNDNVFLLEHYGEDSGSNKTRYGSFSVTATNVTDGDETSKMIWSITKDATFGQAMSLTWITAQGVELELGDGLTEASITSELGSATDLVLYGDRSGGGSSIRLNAGSGGGIELNPHTTSGEVEHGSNQANGAGWKTLIKQISTTNATATTIHSIPVAEGQVVTIVRYLNGIQTNANNRATYGYQSCFFRVAAGNVTEQGSTTRIYEKESNAAWNILFTANIATQSVDLQVVGAAGANINWKDYINYMILS